MYTHMCVFVLVMCFSSYSRMFHTDVLISAFRFGLNAPWPKPVYVKLNEINYLIKLMKSNYAFWTNTTIYNNNFKFYLSIDVQTIHAHYRHCGLDVSERSFDVKFNSGCVASIAYIREFVLKNLSKWNTK